MLFWKIDNGLEEVLVSWSIQSVMEMLQWGCLFLYMYFDITKLFLKLHLILITFENFHNYTVKTNGSLLNSKCLVWNNYAWLFLSHFNQNNWNYYKKLKVNATISIRVLNLPFLGCLKLMLQQIQSHNENYSLMT